MFGGAEGADLMGDLQCAWSIAGPELLHARQHTLLSARAFKTVALVDGVYARIGDMEGLCEDTHFSRRLGFRARAVVNPSQIDPVNTIYSPTEQELKNAAELARTFEAALAQGNAAIRFNGKLVDIAMYRSAKELLEKK
jgi:citrate lyase subunit beta/citryl-CoA lyase